MILRGRRLNEHGDGRFTFFPFGDSHFEVSRLDHEFFTDLVTHEFTVRGFSTGNDDFFVGQRCVAAWVGFGITGPTFWFFIRLDGGFDLSLVGISQSGFFPLRQLVRSALGLWINSVLAARASGYQINSVE